MKRYMLSLFSIFMISSHLAATHPLDGSTVTLRSRATNSLLDSNGAKTVYTMEGNGGAYQEWEIR